MREPITRIRRSIARGRSRMRRLRPRTMLTIGGTLATVVVLSLAGSPDSYALLNSRVVVNAGVISSASLTTTVGATSSLSTSYSGGSTSATGSLTIANTGTAPGTYSTAVSLGSGTAPTLAARIALIAWPVTNAAACTPSASAVSPVSGTLAAPPALTGVLPAQAFAIYCLRTTLTSQSGLSSPSTASATVTATTKAGGWTSSASTSFTQTFTDTVAPSAPTGLTASGTKATSTILSWAASTDNVGVAAYTVYRNGSALATVTAPTTSYADTGLTPGTSYAYTVLAKDAVGKSSALSNPLTVTTASASTSIDPSVIYQIVNTASGRCIDADSWSTNSPTKLQQWDCSTPAGTNQKWQFLGPTAAGTYMVVPSYSPRIAWTVGGASTTNGATVNLADPAPSATNQQWKIVPLASGLFQFTAANSGKCLTLAATGNGAITQQTTCNTADPAQSFRLTAMTQPIAQPTTTNPPAMSCKDNGGGNVDFTWTLPVKDDSKTTGYAVYINVNGTMTKVATQASTGWPDAGLSSTNVPAALFGRTLVEVRQITASGEVSIGIGYVVVLPWGQYSSYTCG